MRDGELDKCGLNGDLPDGTCKYTARVKLDGFGKVCKKHSDRIKRYGDPYATPLPTSATEPTYAEILRRRARGDYNRNADPV